jgi:NAD(P)-dependent dehydrogenase (short-subunit alcohol dehydrogenase family)
MRVLGHGTWPRRHHVDEEKEDACCSNAGIGGPQAPTGEYPLDGWDKVIAIKLSGVFYGMPGSSEHPRREEHGSRGAQGARGMHALGRLGESPEVAELVLWLSSDKASFVTGSYYAVDGGYLAQ